MTSRERIFEAATRNGWTRASTTDRLVMIKDDVVITAWFTSNNHVRTALFEYRGHTDHITGGVPAIIKRLEQ